MRPTIQATVEVGRIHDPSGKIFVNLLAEPGILTFDANLHPNKVMAVLTWVNRWGDRETSTVGFFENADKLDKFCLPRPESSGKWDATWRSDKAVVASQARMYNG